MRLSEAYDNDLGFEAQNHLIRLERVRDQEGISILRHGYGRTMEGAGGIRQGLEDLMRKEVEQQGNLKRWLMGQPLIEPGPLPLQARIHKGPPPQLTQGRGPLPSGPQKMPTPQQQVDLRAQQAQEMIARAEPMPLGAQPQQRGSLHEQAVPMASMPPLPPLAPVPPQGGPVPTALQYEQAAAAQQQMQQPTNGAAKA